MTEATVTIVLFLIVQVATAVWFASRISTTVSQLVDTVAALAEKLDTLLRLPGVIEGLEKRFEDLVRRVLNLEERD